jgi:hypothetical protein
LKGVHSVILTRRTRKDDIESNTGVFCGPEAGRPEITLPLLVNAPVEGSLDEAVMRWLIGHVGLNIRQGFMQKDWTPCASAIASDLTAVVCLVLKVTLEDIPRQSWPRRCA